MATTRSIEQAFKDLNILTALGITAYTVLSLTMLGLTGDAVELMETYQWLPLTGSLAAMLIVFISSGTRDPSRYHPVEMVWVVLSVVLLGAHAFLVEVQDFVGSFDPWGTVVVFFVLLVATAILAR